MKKTVYLIGFIVSFTMSTGIMFELFKWPYAGIIMFSAFLLLNFAFLPIFFYDRYKSSLNHD